MSVSKRSLLLAQCPIPEVAQRILGRQHSIGARMELSGPVLLQDLLKCGFPLPDGTESAIVVQFHADEQTMPLTLFWFNDK